MIATASKNYWRVRSIMEWDDFLQEGHWQWARVVDRYGGTPGMSMPWMMSLFKVTFIGHINTITKAQTRRPSLIFECELHCLKDPPFVLEALGGEEMAMGGFLERMQNAPPEVRKLLEVITTDEGCARWRRPLRRRAGHRETTNERLCKLIGADPEALDLVTMLKNFLVGEETPQCT